MFVARSTQTHCPARGQREVEQRPPGRELDIVPGAGVGGDIMLCMSQLNLSARWYHRVLKLMRTISDLAGSNDIQSAHLAEALHTVPVFIGSTVQS